MPAEVIMPALGMSQNTGRLIAWLKREGDYVNQGEPIMEIETDKTSVEVEASAAGILANLQAQPGDEIPVGQVIALILESGNAELPLPGSVGGRATEPRVSATGITPVAQRVAAAYGVDAKQLATQGKRVTKADVEAYLNGPKPAAARLVPASPKARRLANERGLDVAMVEGSGPGGAVLAADVLKLIEAQAQKLTTGDEPQPTQTTTGVPQAWRRMAERLTESWQTVPHFYLRREVVADGLVTWRANLLSRSETKITYTDLLIKLVAVALRQHPHVNGQWTGEAVAFNDCVNIGLAVAVEDGLLVPVIHNPDTLGVLTIARRRQDLIERTHARKLKPDDLDGGTFTLSNLGMYGIDDFNAIVNPPQAAILAVGRIHERVVAHHGEMVIRPILTLSLSCDHRAVDGRRGALFLDTLAKLIENPMMLID